jgi:hypothetical protein
MVTIPEYCNLKASVDEKGRKIIYYISEQGAAPQFYRLATAKQLVVINAGLIFDESFLKKYASRHPGEIILQRVDVAEGTTIFEPLSEEQRVPFLDAEYRLKVLFRRNLPEQETLVQTERFAPPEMPAVVTQSEDVDVAERLERLAGPFGIMSGGLGDALKEALGIQKMRMRPVVIHLNAASPLFCGWHGRISTTPISRRRGLCYTTTRSCIAGRFSAFRTWKCCTGKRCDRWKRCWSCATRSGF